MKILFRRRIGKNVNLPQKLRAAEEFTLFRNEFPFTGLNEHSLFIPGIILLNALGGEN
jgi:hypothetical protein